jgi:hypothetical protein
MEKSSDEPEPAEHSLDTGKSCSFIMFSKLYKNHLKKKVLFFNLFRAIEFVSFKKISKSNDSNYTVSL